MAEVRVLVVDDDPGVRASLDRALSHEGYQVIVAGDGMTALDRVAECDVMVLDLTMPHLGGLDVCRRMREEGDDTPILVLTARHSTADRVVGLDAGADDYLVKPFALDELLARLRVLVRRLGHDAVAGTATMRTLGDLTLDPSTREVFRGDRRIDLTRTEFALLELFLDNPQQVLTRELIYDRVWGYEESPSSNSLDVFVGYLRKKTEADGEPRLIHTVRGVGFVAREDR
jgi:two-component system response regulator MprA